MIILISLKLNQEYFIHTFLMILIKFLNKNIQTLSNKGKKIKNYIAKNILHIKNGFCIADLKVFSSKEI